MDYTILARESKDFLSELRFNKQSFIRFLGTVAKFHKYPAAQQINLHFHATKSAVAYASKDTWEKLGTIVKEDAIGVPVMDQHSQGQIEYVFDIVDTYDFANGKADNLLWKYNDSLHGGYIDKLYPSAFADKLSVVDKIRSYCDAQTDMSGIKDPDEHDIVSTAAAYVILSRMGFEADNLLKKQLLLMRYFDVNVSDILDKVNKISCSFLNPLGVYIKREEQKNHADERGVFRPGRSDGKQVQSAGDTLGVHEDELSAGAERRGMVPDARRGDRDDGSISEPVPAGERDSLEGDAEEGFGREQGISDRERSTPEASDKGADSADSAGADNGRDSSNELLTTEESGTYKESSEAGKEPLKASEEAEITAFSSGEKPGEFEEFSEVDFEADLSSVSGKRKVFLRNYAAIKLAKKLKMENRYAVGSEIKLLRSYAGWGGLSEAFDPFNNSWKQEYNALQALLTEDEYAAARASTLNAHYTPDEIIQSIYKGLEHLGFKAGESCNILEPAIGSGRFVSNMPENIRAHSNIVGIELDPLSALITERAFPPANTEENSSFRVFNQGLETTNFPNGSFDLAISNVPFGDYKISGDKAHAGENLVIHDYFIAKMLDEVRPGGLVVALTSKGTMDKENSYLREKLADQAELVTAIRLPNNTFSAAGTEAVTDLLILRKNIEGEARDRWPADWTDTRFLQSGRIKHNSFNTRPIVNSFFRYNDDNVIGTFEEVSGPFGRELTVTSDKTVSEIASDIENIISKLPDNVYEMLPDALPFPQQIIEDVAHPFGFIVENGKLLYQESGEKREVTLSEKQIQKIIFALNIRKNIYELLEGQKENCSAGKLEGLQQNLQKSYSDYVKNYGRLFKDKELKQIFGDDYSYPLLLSLEIIDEDGKYFVRQAPIFTERVIKAHTVPDHADTANEALMISMQEKGRVDFSFMAELTGMSYSVLTDELTRTDAIYYDPDKNAYVLAEDYLSGDVREKLDIVNIEIAKIDENIKKFAYDNIFHDFLYPEIPEPENEIEEVILNAYKEDRPLLSWEIPKDVLIAGKYTAKDLIGYIDQHMEDKPALNTIFTLVSRGQYFPEARIDNNDSWDFTAELYRYALSKDSFQDVCWHADGLQKLQNCIARLSGSDLRSRDILFSYDSDFSIDTKRNRAESITFLLERLGQLRAHQKDPDNNTFDPQQTISKFEEYKNATTVKIREFVHRCEENQIEKAIADLVVSMANRRKYLLKNREALEAAKPKDLKPGEIGAVLGSTWIDPEYIKAFLVETLKVSYYIADDIRVLYSEETGEWKIEGAKDDFGNPVATTTYGTSQKNAYELCEAALNLRFPKVYKEEEQPDGSVKKVVDSKATLEAQLKQEELKKAFQDWIWNDPERSASLAEYYNRNFNNIVPRQYNGDELTFPGISTTIELKKHQKDAVAHSLYGGNTLFAHAVGAGKTFEIATAIMESHRLGLSHKAIVAVPKHLTGQFGAEFLRIYPQAKILVATKDDFTKENRNKFCAKIVSQDWDAIVMSYSQFERIPLSPEKVTDFLKEEITRLMNAEIELKAANGANWTLKRMESYRKKLEAKMTKLKENNGKNKDHTVYFEDLGIDKLAIDEAHYFKNLYINTKMSNVAGVQTSTANKSEDLLLKCKYLNEKTNNKALIFATGTPVSNSMVELYTMQRYLQPDRLQKMKLNNFDAWAANFGQVVLSMELKPEGQGFQEKERFAKFHNLPELMSLYKEIADVRTADMLDLQVPEVEYIVEKLPASQLQKEMINNLANRAEMIRNRQVKPEADNMLKVTHEGRSVALDPRILNADFPDVPSSKINKCVENVFDIYVKTSDERSTQLIFCDQSTPSTKNEFNVYSDIKKKLIDKGVPAREIAFIHDAKNEKAKEVLFEKVRNGEIRVLLGSTDMLGTGTNVQDKLIASHDLDVPWKPSALEQRLGRIMRQGNQNKNVKVFRYVTEGTFDAYMWQIIEKKLRFIGQIMTSKTPERVAEEVDELTLSAAEIKAIATGNPLIKEKMEVENSLTRLKISYSQYIANRHKLNVMINTDLPQRIKSSQELTNKLLQDKIMFEKNTQVSDEKGNEVFQIEINKHIYTDKELAAKVFANNMSSDYHNITGYYKGFKFWVTVDFSTSKYIANFKGNVLHRLPLTTYGEFKNCLDFKQMEKMLVIIEKDINRHTNEIEQLENSLRSAKEESEKPFSMQAEMDKLIARSVELDQMINKKDDINESHERDDDESEDEEEYGR